MSILLWALIPTCYSQTTSLSGSINTTSTSITSIVPASANVVSTTGFSLNDTVLVIQMKGAVMNESNTSSFGSIASISDAGNYELAVICAISGLTITFQTTLTKSFSATNGYVQMIKVPSYVNVTVDGILNAPAWDVATGTGGVLIIYASGSVTLNAGISMDERGFAGGWAQNDYSACNCGCSFSADPIYTDYYYVSGTCRAASKGEGIADTIIGKEFGRGPQINGGGGGNDHNSGGGGGANYGAGGLGGISTTPSCFFGQYCRGNFPGIGANNLAGYYGAADKVFLGGGGGAGHSNNPLDTRGKNGGGIVIIIANSLDGLGQTISARGGNVTALNDGDGAGAGGAGGSIMLDVNSISANPLAIDASGGYGGNLTAFTATNCKGPGGGGGGGVIWSQNTLPGSAATNTAGGANGVQLSGPCAGQTMGTVAGSAGGIITGLSINVTSLTCLPLSVEMGDFIANCTNDQILLQWQTLSENDNDYFEIQYSNDGFNFESLDAVEGAGQSQATIDYSYSISQRLYFNGYFRLKQFDYNGQFDYSTIIHLNCSSNESNVQIINGKLVILNGSEVKGCTIHDMLGRQIFSGNPTEMNFNFEAQSFYFVQIESKDGFSSHKVYSY